jgi:hypothetical protein
MSRWPSLILLAVTLAVAWAIVTSADRLPETVASSFGAHGAPRAWMTRDFYRGWMLAFGVGLPWIVFLAIAVAPRALPRYVNLPHKDYWLAPDRREKSLRDLAGYGAVLAVLMALFSGGIHALVIEAHAVTPPRLPLGPFLSLLGSLIAAIGVWAIALHRRFGRPPGKL